MLAIGLSLKARYYAVFKIAEGAVTGSGLSYNGTDKTTGNLHSILYLGKQKYDRIYMIDIFCTELCVFQRSIVEEWNRPVQLWLKNCIHRRIPCSPLGKMFVTFLFSAIWHGCYPLYIYGFLFYSITTVNFNYIYKMFVVYKFLRTPIFYLSLR